jgi:hypothetical protein
MDIFLAWLLFPIVLFLISVALGIGIRFLLRESFESALVLPVGVAGIILILEFFTTEKFSVIFAVPVLMAVTVTCAILLRSEFYKFFRRNRDQSLVAFLTYSIYLLPVSASGMPSIAGWIKLDDSATWLAYSDRLIEAGRNTTGLSPSSYEAVLQLNLNPAAGAGPGYPIGAFLPLGAIAKLIGVDPAWAFQPYISFLAAVLAVVLFVALKKLIPFSLLRGVVAITSTCSALLYGYAMWGGIKELALALFIALLTYFAVTYTSLNGLTYSVIPFAIVASSILAISGPSGAIWILFPSLYLLYVSYKEQKSKITTGKSLFALLLSMLILCLPIFLITNILNLDSLFNYAKGSPDIGNLVGPLARKEILGIWPAGDFRFAPTNNNGPLNLALIIIACLAVAGVIYSWKSGHHFVAFIAVSSTLLSLLFSFGNAWVGGKAIAISSPFLLLCALYGIIWLIDSKRFIEASLSSIIVVGGVLLSLGLIYHEVWLAPYDQLKELQQIGQDTRLSSPALMLEYSPYGARHFLRNLGTESAGELRRNQIPMNNGIGLAKGAAADIDEFPLTSIEPYNTLVLQRSPNASRPPSNYHLLYSKHFYEVWQKDPSTNTPLKHRGFGDLSIPAKIVKCSELANFAKSAASTDSIATVIRDTNLSLDLSQNNLPAGWSKGSSPGSVIAPNSGQLSMKTIIEKSGDYLIWLGGSFRGRSEITIDQNQKYSWSSQINHPSSFTQMGKVFLTSGEHNIQLNYHTSFLSPGVGGFPFEFGPVVLSTTSGDTPVVKVKPNQIKTLCGKELDWIEIVR